MIELLTDPQLIVAFLTLTVLELVLGIDNIIFISILVDKLPPERRAFARRLGLFLAMFMRLALLSLLAWLAGLSTALFELFGHGFSARDLILLFGGLFLVWKSTGEIHQLMEGEEGEASSAVKATFAAVITQIIVIDLVFSLDSIITAIGMVNNLTVMIAAVVASVGLMMVASAPIGDFVSAHPTVKMLALSFLMVVGVVLLAEGFGHHVPKGYIYSAMAFSVVVEMLNIRMRKRAARPVALREPYVAEKVATKRA
ncbi:TerC family protein [Aromatoleum aromaticum]|uniref:TerC family protein n=1 Tax=Aromatoleum aromaticum TaxID=551760 RepID=UPI0014598377|nr:TerC family protein [Aromatoleum aromaticum]NMG53833.1 TerC family protein [Aromatoleum aromaticum]